MVCGRKGGSVAAAMLLQQTKGYMNSAINLCVILERFIGCFVFYVLFYFILSKQILPQFEFSSHHITSTQGDEMVDGK